jgi:ankyrin repeat protein
MVWQRREDPSSIEKLKLLLAAGADPNYRPREKALGTALGEAAQLKLLEPARLLFAAGADLNALHVNRTPLAIAIDLGQIDFVRWLLDAGADPDGQTKEHWITAAEERKRWWEETWKRAEEFAAGAQGE